MSNKAAKLVNYDPEARSGAPDARGILRPPSLQAKPDLGKAIRGFSAALNDLKEILKELANQKDQKAPATIQDQALEEHYRELFTGAPGGYLVTDTDGIIQESNQTAAELLRAPKDSLTRRRLISFVSQKDHEAFYSLVEDMLQRREIKEIKVHLEPPGLTPFPVRLAVAGRRNSAGELTGFNWLMHSLPPSLQEEVLKSELAQLKSYVIGLVKVFSTALEMKDLYATGHQRRVAQLGVALAEEMGFTSDRLEGLKIAALLHDIGKIAIPSYILSNTGQLRIVESKIIKIHPELGYNLLKDIEFPWPVAQAVLQHHERWNGSGYPNGFSENDIIVEARIIAVADVVEAMLSPRPNGTAVGIDEALEELCMQRGILYDPQVVDTCLKLLIVKDFKFD
jgi:putative nucleotidyltransferase with HDIG domain/PAS domain S-box-containing protein